MEVHLGGLLAGLLAGRKVVQRVDHLEGLMEDRLVDRWADQRVARRVDRSGGPTVAQREDRWVDHRLDRTAGLMGGHWMDLRAAWVEGLVRPQQGVALVVLLARSRPPWALA